MGSLFSSVQPHRGFSAVLTSFLLYEITANLCLCMFPSQMCFLLDPKQSKHRIYQKVPRNCINCLIGAYLTASSLQLRPASRLLDRTPLRLHQLLFTDKHPSWNPPTPPSILLPFTCFASWQHTVKWKHLLFPSLRCKQVSRGEVSDFPVFVSACPDSFVGADTHTCGSVNPANLWGWVQNLLQQQCLRLCPVFWHLERWIPKFYGADFRMPFPSQHFRACELNIWTENLWATAQSTRSTILHSIQLSIGVYLAIFRDWN